MKEGRGGLLKVPIRVSVRASVSAGGETFSKFQDTSLLLIGLQRID